MRVVSSFPSELRSHIPTGTQREASRTLKVSNLVDRPPSSGLRQESVPVLPLNYSEPLVLYLLSSAFTATSSVEIRGRTLLLLLHVLVDKGVNDFSGISLHAFVPPEK